MLSDTNSKLLNSPYIAIVGIPTEKRYTHQTPVWVVQHNSRIYFSTKRDRAKFRHLQSGKKVGMTIVHPEGKPYFSAYCDASIKYREEFAHYNEIVDKIVHQYVPEENREEMCKNLLDDQLRILVELELITVFPSE